MITKKENILSINSYLKYIEFFLASIANSDDSKSLGDLKKEFKKKFNVDSIHASLTQNFGIIRLLPLIFMVQDLHRQASELDDDIRKIRNSLVHLDFDINNDGYIFYYNDKKEKLFKSYQELPDFIYKIENKYYKL